MYSGNGPRNVIQHINFNKKYEKTPHVMVSLSKLDVNNQANARLDLNAININTSGFDLKIDTWLDSSTFGIKVSWISFG